MYKEKNNKVYIFKRLETKFYTVILLWNADYQENANGMHFWIYLLQCQWIWYVKSANTDLSVRSLGTFQIIIWTQLNKKVNICYTYIWHYPEIPRNH